jgi:heme/copper-type cytochrome/quinol oxidase subunit 3
MNAAERMRFLLPISVAGFLGAFFVIGGIYLFELFSQRKHAGPGEWIFFVAFFLPIGFWLF